MPAEYDDAINQPDISQPSAKPRITLRQVAQRAGVSTAAASAALTGRRGTTRVSRETAQMIQNVAMELGYESPAAARGRELRQTRVLALALPYAAGFWDSNPFNEAIFHGAAEAAARAGCDLLLAIRRNHAWQQWDAAALIDKPAAGVLVVAPAVGSPILSALAAAGYPAVAAVCDPDQCPVPSVNAEDAEGARAAVTYLLRLGHRRIGLLAGSEELGPSRPRFQGYQDALVAFGLAPSPSLVASTTPDERGGFRAAVALLTQQPRPTALFAFNDLSARGAIDAARQMGLSVPGQLSVVGFDDAPFAAHTEPPLTTVRYPTREIAAAALEYLVRLTHQASSPAVERSPRVSPPAEIAAPAITLPTQLVVRQSCAPPATDRTP